MNLNIILQKKKDGLACGWEEKHAANSNIKILHHMFLSHKSLMNKS